MFKTKKEKAEETLEDKEDYSIYFLNGIAIALGIAILLSLNGIRIMQRDVKVQREKERTEYYQKLADHITDYQEKYNLWSTYIVKLQSGITVNLPPVYEYKDVGSNTYELDDTSLLKISDWEEKYDLHTQRENLIKKNGKNSDISKVKNLNSYINYFTDYTAGITGRRTCYIEFDSGTNKVYTELSFNNNTVNGVGLEEFLAMLSLGFRGEYKDNIEENLETIQDELERSNNLMADYTKDK